MKKMIACILSVLMLTAALTACGRKAPAQEAADGTHYTVGICNYVDDASLNQIVENLRAQLEKLGEELADACNVAYELTFLVMGIACAVYVLGIKKQRLIPRQEGPKYIGAVCETIGQFFYIYALADTEHVAFAAPIISSYCVASVIWGRIFLKEKLSKKHYACIALVVAGIVILGILDI